MKVEACKGVSDTGIGIHFSGLWADVRKGI